MMRFLTKPLSIDNRFKHGEKKNSKQGVGGLVRSLFMAYEGFEKSGFQGFLLAQSWTVKTKTGACCGQCINMNNWKAICTTMIMDTCTALNMLGGILNMFKFK